MKYFQLKKLLMMLALVIIAQNGVTIVVSTDGNTGSYSEEDGVAPCSDLPPLDDAID